MTARQGLADDVAAGVAGASKDDDGGHYSAPSRSCLGRYKPTNEPERTTFSCGEQCSRQSRRGRPVAGQPTASLSCAAATTPPHRSVRPSAEDAHTAGLDRRPRHCTAVVLDACDIPVVAASVSCGGLRTLP